MNLFCSREQPLENSERIPDVISSDEQWFDCETHSPVNLKEGQRTPIYISTPSICPGAPVRHGHSFLPLSDDDLDDDSDDLDEAGVRPLDSSHTMTIDKPDKEPKAKRMRCEVKHVEETITTAESRFSDLHYLEATGTVTIKRHGSEMDEPVKRDCRMLVSYRVHKVDSAIQIALIVYKSNTKTKTRRKLFQQKLHEPSSTRTHSSTSRSRTEEKDRKKFEEKMSEISTAPPGVKYSQATKRPSKTSLRF